MSETIYIIMCCQGSNFGDHYEYPLVAFETKDKAEEVVNRLTAFAEHEKNFFEVEVKNFENDYCGKNNVSLDFPRGQNFPKRKDDIAKVEKWKLDMTTFQVAKNKWIEDNHILPTIYEDLLPLFGNRGIQKDDSFDYIELKVIAP